MVGNNGEEPTGRDDFNEINDEEGLVDRKTKGHILDLRRQIDEDERRLFIELEANPQSGINHIEATQYWAVTVKQYLRSIKRLWGSTKDDEDHNVKGVREYWEEKKIGTVELPPPDKNGYQFSLCANEELGDEQLRRNLDLPRGTEIPRPVERDFFGLSSILEGDTVEHTWRVWVQKEGARPNWEDEILYQARPLPKGLLEKSVEEADNFLQQAGIGFDIGDNLPTDGI